MNIDHCGFFVLRTPLLPFDEVQRWSDSLLCATSWKNGEEEQLIEEALNHDVILLRGRLAQIINAPEIRQALAVASPSLLHSISTWERDPESKKGRQAERSLVRYFLRMSSRSTPFGLFSGCSVGRVSPKDDTVFELASRQSYRSATRLDFDYLFALTSELRRNPDLQIEMRYGWNSSLQRIGSNWHYVESRASGQMRSHHLIKLCNDEYLNSVLVAAKRGGRSFEEMRAAIRACECSEALTHEEIDGFLRDMIESEILVSNVSPTLTGESPLNALLDELRKLPSAKNVYKTLLGVQESMLSLDHSPLGADPAEYSSISASLESLPASVNEAHLLQVDMFKPVLHAVVGQVVLDELFRVLTVLDRIMPSGEPPDLGHFRDRFANRYDDKWISLVEALDWEAGVGYGTTPSAGGSPLLRGLQLDASKGTSDINLNGFQLVMLQKVLDCAKMGGSEINLSEADFGASEDVDGRLPESFCVISSLVASSPEALRDGQFELIYKGGLGPSSARLLGRFCVSNAELAGLVRNALREEESNDPEAIYAEIVYLPEGRAGNILCRPVLRDYEVVHLGLSGAPAEKQLPAGDLMVTLKAGEIILYSQRLRRRLIPRMSNAHNFGQHGASAIYRFLCDMQNQGGARVPSFNWGAMAKLEALPRVRMGRIILASAQWRISTEESRSFADLNRRGAFLKMKEFQRARALPRWVWLSEGDNTLPVDFDNPLSVDALLHLLKRSNGATLVEMYPQSNSNIVTGPEGRFEHELVLPLSHKRKMDKSASSAITHRDEAVRHIDSSCKVRQSERLFPPGSEWQFVKLYGGEASLDDMLAGDLGSLLMTFLNDGIVPQWFFIRYADPEPHLRLRFQTLDNDASLKIMDTINSFLISGLTWRVQLDTYRREVVRYGGLEGVKAVEKIFCADSDAVVRVLRALNQEDDLDVRWKLALLGIDILFTDFGLDLAAKLKQALRSRNALSKEFGLSAATKEEIGNRFRRERTSLLRIMRREVDERDLATREAVNAFAQRSKRIRAAVSDLRSLEQYGSLETPFLEIVESIAHMHVNRLLRSSQRAHEYLLYNFLYRIYDSDQARANRSIQR